MNSSNSFRDRRSASPTVSEVVWKGAEGVQSGRGASLLLQSVRGRHPCACEAASRAATAPQAARIMRHRMGTSAAPPPPPPPPTRTGRTARP